MTAIFFARDELPGGDHHGLYALGIPCVKLSKPAICQFERLSVAIQNGSVTLAYGDGQKQVRSLFVDRNHSTIRMGIHNFRNAASVYESIRK